MYSKGFADLLERGEFLQRVSEQDQQIIKLVHDAKADATATAARLDKLEVRQQQLTAIVQQRRDEIARAKQGLIDTQGRARRDARRTRRARWAACAPSASSWRATSPGSRPSRPRSRPRCSRRRAPCPPGRSSSGNGSLIWPVNGPITSPFCERRAWEACHPGIDIGVADRHADPRRRRRPRRPHAGVGASGGYGNFTCIQHTGALSTCYAHQSRFATSLGAQRQPGPGHRLLAAAPALCFGPHLHFEVRINGAVTNPLNYL